jgi:hypothetical protein
MSTIITRNRKIALRLLLKSSSQIQVTAGSSNLMSTSIETQHPKINHKCNTHEIVFRPLNNKASKIDRVIMLETSFVQRHNASCKNGIQKLKITTVDLSLRRWTQKNRYLRMCRSFLKQCWLLQKPQVRAPPTPEKHWKFLTLFRNHTQRPYRRQATTAPDKLATRCSSAILFKTLSLDTKLRPKRNNSQRSGHKLFLECNTSWWAKL